MSDADPEGIFPSILTSIGHICVIFRIEPVFPGGKTFSRYLGDEQAAWLQHDASAFMRQRRTPFEAGILIDQGLADKFLEEQLKLKLFNAACKEAAQPLTLRRHRGYDRGYYFISSFMEDHHAFRHCVRFMADSGLAGVPDGARQYRRDAQ